MSQDVSFDTNAKSPAHLLKRVSGGQRVVLFYDPDIFTQNLTISVSLLTGEDVPGQTHYNTLHFPNTALGAGIPITAVPASTKIIGVRRVLPLSQHTYFIATDYDPAGQYTYQWEVVEGSAQVYNAGTRQVRVQFGDEPHNITLQCSITNADGGTRRIQAILHVGAQPKKLLVIRGTRHNEE